MEHIRVIFGRSRHPFSYAIRLFTWSHWSHIGVIMPDDTVIEAKGGEGVVVTPLDTFKARYPEWREAKSPVKSRREAFKFLRDQVGKPYDFTAVISMPLRRNWQETDSWFCSELVATAQQLYRQEYIKRITPEDNWRLSFD